MNIGRIARSFGAGLVVWLAVATLPAPAAAEEEPASPAARNERYLKAVADLAAELNNAIRFYGRVVDLDGAAVAAAAVRVTVRVAGAILPAREFERFTVTADNDGRFTVTAFGDVVGVDEIVRDGYEYHYKYNRKRDFKSQRKEKAGGAGFEADKPFVFRVRKLGPPAFVVIHNMTFGKKPGNPSMFDLVKRSWVHREADIIAMQYSSIDRDWHTDIKLSVDGEPGKLRLLLEAPDPESGFIVEKHEFFAQMTEAPEHGYRQKVEVPVREGESPLMVYVKGQGGLFYARLNIEFDERQPGIVAVNATSFTNLSGGRGLEYIPSVESQYDREVFSDHARKEIRRADLLSGQPIAMPKPKPKNSSE